MDPDTFAMSSYQFVNSLASCYPQSQMNQHPPSHSSTTNNNNNTASSNQPSGNDYFPTSAYTPNLYPGTPQAHYASQAYGLGGVVGSGGVPGGGGSVTGSGAVVGQNPADMVDYTQLQPQRLLLNQAQNPSSQTSLNTSSCKYASETASSNNNTSISSPQDLTTARDISPKLSPNSVVETVARSINKTSSSTVSSSSTTNNHSTTVLNSNHTTNLPLHSPGGETDTDSESGGEGGGNSSSGKKGSGPPQIYPWMKRVHLGQSEYFI